MYPKDKQHSPSALVHYGFWSPLKITRAKKEGGKEPSTLWSSDNRRESKSIVTKLKVEECGMGCMALKKSCPSESGVHDMENKQGDILTRKHHMSKKEKKEDSAASQSSCAQLLSYQFRVFRPAHLLPQPYTPTSAL